MEPDRLLTKVGVDSAVLSSVKDRSVVAMSGFNLATTPEHLILKLFEAYQESGHPRELFVVSDALPAIPGRALDSVCEELCKLDDQRFLRGMLMPYLGWAPSMQRLVVDEKLEAYSWPIGVTAFWFRALASGGPGAISRIGVDTVLDPRQEGGRLNERANKERTCKIDVLHIGDEEYLLYQAPKPDYALIRATTADEGGNLTMEDEGIRGTVLDIAQAAKARPNPGVVIAQVRWLTKSGTLNPKEVEVPGPLVDFVVLSPDEHHWQSRKFDRDPRISYRVMPPLAGDSLASFLPPRGRDHERIIARRVLLELIGILEKKGSPVLVDTGLGLPALVPQIAAEEDVTQYVTTVLESGQWGGIAFYGEEFGLAVNPFALSSLPDMFSNFEGGIIDAASLGFLQVDPQGNVNPSMLPGKIYGPGGFPDLSGGAPRVYFAGAFTAGQSKLKIEGGRLKIVQDGDILKFVRQLYKSLFSAREAAKHGKDVLYITERAVFRLTAGGLVLEELAPGVDLEKDVLGKMEFGVEVSPKLEEMDGRLFAEGKMGAKEMVSSILSR